MKRVAVFLFLTTLWRVSFSQTISVSPYSVYGIGVITEKGSALNRSAGTGIAVRDVANLNMYNPASYTSITSATQIFEMGFYTERNFYRTSKESDNLTTGSLSGINSWYRFSKRWAGVVGIAPYSKVNYNISSTRSIGTDEDAGVVFSGSGGISQVYFGNAFQITRGLSIGVDGSYLFGSIDKNESIVSGYGSGTTLLKKVTANKLKADFGMQYSFRMKKDRSLTLGLVYNPQVKLNTKAERMLLRTNEGDTTARAKVDVDDYVLPQTFGAGLSFQTPRSTLAVDVRYQEWAKATLENNVDLRNTTKTSFSYTYEGNPKGEKFWDFVQVRTGLHFQNNYLKLDEGSFNDWGFSFGLGLPVRQNLGTINLSYHYNRSGTTTSGLIEQHSNSIVVDFTFRDLWGIRRKFD